MLAWLTFIFVSTISWATTEVRFNYDVQVHGREICRGTEVVTLEQLREICRRDFNDHAIEVRASIKEVKKGQYNVSAFITRTDKGGQPISLSSPQVILLHDEPAEVVSGIPAAPNLLALKVRVTDVY